jgi:hypothetical protein
LSSVTTGKQETEKRMGIKEEPDEVRLIIRVTEEGVEGLLETINRLNSEAP